MHHWHEPNIISKYGIKFLSVLHPTKLSFRKLFIGRLQVFVAWLWKHTEQTWHLRDSTPDLPKYPHAHIVKRILMITLTRPTLCVAVWGLVDWGRVGCGVSIDYMTEGGAAGARRHLTIQTVGGWTETWPWAKICTIHWAVGGNTQGVQKHFVYC